MFGEKKMLNSGKLQKSVGPIKCKSKDVAMMNWQWYKLIYSETLSHSISLIIVANLQKVNTFQFYSTCGWLVHNSFLLNNAHHISIYCIINHWSSDSSSTENFTDELTF